MHYSLLLTNAFLKPIMPLLDSRWTVFTDYATLSMEEKQQISALATSVWDNIDAAFLSQFPALKRICHLGIGTDNIDIPYLQQHQIELLSQPDAGIHDTAELAVTLMLNLTRKIRQNDAYARANHWIEKKTRFIGNHVSGKQLGLVGFGKIGSAIAGFAAAFGMKIAYCARSNRHNGYSYYPQVEELARASDVLIVCCSASAETRHLINREVLQSLGSDGYLVNVARGSVVDQNALIDALQHQVIAGAALDVFTEEPIIPQALRELDNVLLSPHMGSSTKENLQYMYQLQAQQLHSWLVLVAEGEG